MADAACRESRCSGHGTCAKLYERCICDDGWGFPNCRGDFTSSTAKTTLKAFNIITIILVVAGLLLSTWRIYLLWRAKRANAPQLAGRSCWAEVMRGVDSQLCCNFCVWLCFATTLPLPIADIFENCYITYNFVYTTESVAALGCAYFIRVFALMVAKTSSSTQKVVRGLDVSMAAYMIGATASNLIRSFTSQQTSTLGWYLVVVCDVGYTILLIVGSSVYSVTVLRKARANVTKLLAAASANPATLSASVRATAWGAAGQQGSPHRTVTANGDKVPMGGLMAVPEHSNHSPRSQANGKFFATNKEGIPQPHSSPSAAGGAAARYAMTTSPGGSGSAGHVAGGNNSGGNERPPSSPGQYALMSSPHVHSHPPALSLEGREVNRRSTLPLGTTGAFFGVKSLTISVPVSPRVPLPGASPTNTTAMNTTVSPAPPAAAVTVVVQTIPTPSASSAVANLTAQQANLTAVVGALHGIQITGGIAILFTIVVAMGLSHEKELWASVITLISTYYVPIVIAYLLLLTMGRRPRQTAHARQKDSTGGTKPSR